MFGMDVDAGEILEGLKGRGSSDNEGWSYQRQKDSLEMFNMDILICDNVVRFCADISSLLELHFYVDNFHFRILFLPNIDLEPFCPLFAMFSCTLMLLSKCLRVQHERLHTFLKCTWIALQER